MDDPTQGIDEMQRQLTALEASVSSPAAIIVVAGPGGAIRDVVFADAAVKQPASALAAELKTALQQAVAVAARQQARIVDEQMGGQLGTYDRVLQNQATPSAPRSTSSSSRSRRRSWPPRGRSRSGRRATRTTSARTAC